MSRVSALCIFFAASTAYADQALVVGVQNYPNLPRAQTLEGCVSDSKAMGAQLKKLGFRVHALTNQQATHKGILDALAQMANKVGKDERFVFYFAGHGRDMPHFALMPADAIDTGTDITPEALDSAVRAIKCKSRTVILDACFSGGFTKGIVLRPRYYMPEGTKSSGPRRKAAGQDANAHLGTTGEVCYYTASMATELALEGVFGGKPGGLFTHALLDHLGDPKQRWGTVNEAVKQDLAMQLANQGISQNPTLSPSYVNVALFGGKAEAAPAGPPPKTVLDLFSADHIDAKSLSFAPEPDKAEFQAGENLRLKVKVGKAGYLVILGKNGDKYYCFHPGQTKNSFSSADCKADAGTVAFPVGADDPPLYFDEPGSDFVKALLFNKKEDAQALLDAMKDYQDGISAAEMQRLRVNKGIGASSKSVPLFLTSGLTYVVGDSLIGGDPLKEADALFKRLSRGADAITRYMWDRLPTEVREQLRAYFGDAPLPDAGKGLLVAGLNRAIQAKPLYDAAAFKGVALSAETKALLAKKPTQGADMVTLNRMLLEDAFPEVGRSR